MAISSRRAMLCGVAALPALNLPAMAGPADPHEAYRERLHAAHAEHALARPIDNVARYGSVEEVACTLVAQRLWGLADEVLALPVPTTLGGLGVVGLAMAVIYEGCVRANDKEEWRTAQLARAIITLTGEKLPVTWRCWGDASGDHERDCAAHEGLGVLPAWALAEAAATA